MRQELRQRWTAALRSGEYREGKTFLRTKDNRFNALGVLVDLVDWKWKGPGEKAYYLDRPEDRLLGESASLVPERFRSIVGLDRDVLKTLYRKIDRGATFTEIADWLDSRRRV